MAQHIYSLTGLRFGEFTLLLAAAPQPGGPRPKGTESSGTLHTALCKPSQPRHPASLFCARGSGARLGGGLRQNTANLLHSARSSLLPGPWGTASATEGVLTASDGSSRT